MRNIRRTALRAAFANCFLLWTCWAAQSLEVFGTHWEAKQAQDGKSITLFGVFSSTAALLRLEALLPAVRKMPPEGGFSQVKWFYDQPYFRVVISCTNEEMSVEIEGSDFGRQRYEQPGNFPENQNDAVYLVVDNTPTMSLTDLANNPVEVQNGSHCCDLSGGAMKFLRRVSGHGVHRLQIFRHASPLTYAVDGNFRHSENMSAIELFRAGCIPLMSAWK